MDLFDQKGSPIASVDHCYIVVNGTTLVGSGDSMAYAIRLAAEQESYRLYAFRTIDKGYTSWVEIPVKRNRHYVAHV